MTARRPIANLVAVIVLAAGVSALVGVTTAAANSPVPDSSAPAVARGGFGDCPQFSFCDYIYDNGYRLCFKVDPFSGFPSDNWSSYGCRNVDGAIWNNTPFTFRVFYAPKRGDPHACIPPWTKVRDLFNYDFNSGRGPHNLVVGNDIASFIFDLSRCTNTPL